MGAIASRFSHETEKLCLNSSFFCGFTFFLYNTRLGVTAGFRKNTFHGFRLVLVPQERYLIQYVRRGFQEVIPKSEVYAGSARGAI